MSVRRLPLVHRGKTYTVEIDPGDGPEVSDRITILDDRDLEVSSYDSVEHTDADRIDEAISELDEEGL